MNELEDLVNSLLELDLSEDPVFIARVLKHLQLKRYILSSGYNENCIDHLKLTYCGDFFHKLSDLYISGKITDKQFFYFSKFKDTYRLAHFKDLKCENNQLTWGESSNSKVSGNFHAITFTLDPDGNCKSGHFSLTLSF